MQDSGASFEELYGDVTHEDWCPLDDPAECDGTCNLP